MKNLWCKLFHSEKKLIIDSRIGDMVYSKTGAYRNIFCSYVCLKCGRKWEKKLG